MIDHNLKFIFIHCQKCAGESIEKSLTGKADKGYKGDHFEGSPEKHASISFYKKNYKKEFQTYFKFTIVRNPYDRFISWVRYRDMRWGLYKGILSHENLLKEADLEIYKKNTYKRLLSLNPIIPINIFRISDNLSERRSTKDINFIAKFENLYEDFNYIKEKLAFDVELPHINKSTKNKTHYSKFYNEELIEKIGKLYKFDLNYFNYKFQFK